MYKLKNPMLIAVSVALTGVGLLDVKAEEREIKPTGSFVYRNETLPLYDGKLWLPEYAAAPLHPENTEGRKVSGEAVVIAVIGPRGRAEHVEIVESAPTASFGEASRTAVLRWRYPVGGPRKGEDRYAVRVFIAYRYVNKKVLKEN